MTDKKLPAATTDELPADHKTYWDRRQEERMPTVNHGKGGSIVAWDPRLAFEVVLAGADKAMEVFERYKITREVASDLLQNPVFQEQLKRYAREIEADGGLSYRQRAKILAEDLLPYAYDICTSTEYPAAVRADMIQWMTKVADLEPEKRDGKNIPQTGGFSLQILFAGEAGKPAVQTVAGPVTIEAPRE